ncbi:MAG: DUF1398 family protein [Pyrinomonadaceae bacterium]|nr:DUF1398 family protein [Pyrinomonadaceae bacterium]
MRNAIENLLAAQQLAMATRPKVGGFPYLAEVLRKAGVKHNIWQLPACQSVYITDAGPVVSVMPSLIDGTANIPDFDREGLIKAIRVDQAGGSTFIEFLKATWKAGVITYEVDFNERIVTYRGVHGEEYVEHYSQVEV